jgi:hypothetical protein
VPVLRAAVNVRAAPTWLLELRQRHRLVFDQHGNAVTHGIDELAAARNESLIERLGDDGVVAVLDSAARDALVEPGKIVLR